MIPLPSTNTSERYPSQTTRPSQSSTRKPLRFWCDCPAQEATFLLKGRTLTVTIDREEYTLTRQPEVADKNLTVAKALAAELRGHVLAGDAKKLKEFLGGMLKAAKD